MIGKEILNYTILSLIGSGGMGSVYLAENKYIRQQKVAIKVINANMVNDFTRQRMKEEAEHLASLDHPNIVRFMNYHADNEGNIYLVMEYAEGMSLDKFISKKNGLIVEERIAPMFEPLLDAVGYAHRKRILHRDIKPNNIIITPDGTPKILDFGIATLMREDNESAGQIIGTPSYMSPEQVRGETLDERSDIYSLGVVLFQMMTGRQPYDTTTMNEMEIMQKVTGEPLPPMRSYYKHISDKVQRVVDKATAKDKQKRFSTCQEFKQALHSAIYPEKVSRGVKYGIAALVALLLGGGFGLWDYTREKVRYYNDYAEVYGIPQGIGKVSFKEHQHRRATYQMTYQKGKLREMKLVNAHGTLVEHSDTEFMHKRYSYTKFFYTADGKIDYKEVYSATMHPICKMDYSDNLKTITFRRFDAYDTEAPIQMQTTATVNVDNNQKSRISRFLLTYDENGYVVLRMYAGLANRRVSDGAGIFGIAYSYDEKGREVEEYFVDATGKIKGNSINLAQKIYTYDELDHWTSVRYLSANGGASHDGNQVYEVEINYDQWGNRIGEKYYDANHQSVCRSDMKAFGLAYKLDEYGNTIEYTYLGEQWQPTLNNNGVQAIRLEYDERGYNTRMSYYAPNKNKAFVRSLKGDTMAVAADSLTNEQNDNLQLTLAIFKEYNMYYAIREYEYDERGNVIMVRYYDTNHTLVEQGNSPMQVVFAYDEHSNQTEYSGLNEQSQPTRLSGGHFYEVYVFDSLDQMVQLRYLDSVRQPYLVQKEGFAVMNTVYNAHGDPLSRSFFDTNNNPVMLSDGYAQYEYEYDAIGNCISVRYLDTKGQLVKTSYGYARCEYVYDEKDNFHIATKYYDTADNILYSYHYQYDERGNLTGEYVIDAKGKLYGNTVYEHSVYDANNFLTECYYTNLQGHRIKKSKDEPYASVKYVRDKNGNIIESSYWDEKGKPALDNQKTHRRVSEYDAMHRVIHQISYGVDGKPIRAKDGKAEGRVEYDAYGNFAQITTYDGYQNPVEGWDGVYKIVMQHDLMGNRTLTEYYDKNNRLVVSKDEGYARCETKYNERQLDIENRYYDQRNQLVRIETNTYNSKGKLLVWQIYNGKMKADDSKYGFAKWEIVYAKDEITPVQRQVYDASGNMLIYAVYNPKTESWGDWQSAGTRRSAPSQSNSQRKNTGSSTSTQWKKNVAEINAELPTTFELESLTLRWMSMEILSSGNVMSKFQLDKSQYEVLPSEITALKKQLSSLMGEIKSRLDIPASIKMSFELYDNKNRQL